MQHTRTVSLPVTQELPEKGDRRSVGLNDQVKPGIRGIVHHITPHPSLAPAAARPARPRRTGIPREIEITSFTFL